MASMNDERRWFGLAVLIGALLLARVLFVRGPSNGLELAKVRGRVTFKGEPPRAGDVLLHPDSSKGTVGPPAIAPIREDGTYVLSTERPCDGALVGFHKVVLAGREPETGAESDASVDGANPVPRRASRTASRSAVTRLLTPSRLGDPATSGVVVEVKRGSNTLDFGIQESGEVAIGR